MESTRVTRTLTDIASINYPSDASIKLSLFNTCSFTVPNSVVKAACILGLFTAIYHSKGIARSIYSSISYIIRRVTRCFEEESPIATAVIYGATSKVGRSFSFKFAAEGAKLILIDYSAYKLNRLKQSLTRNKRTSEENIICCVLEQTSSLLGMRADGGLSEVYEVLNAQKVVTYFVNCRNTKIKDILLYHQQKSEHIVLMTYYNMTVFAAILRKTLKIMSQNKGGRVIHVNNTYKQEKTLKRTHPLFYSTMQFAITLTRSLALTYEEQGVDFLVVNSNHRDVANNRRYAELAGKSLELIGITSDIFI